MISVIIPVYNVEDYLHVCINSVLKQTYQDFEIICIDDASTDSSLEILEYFAQKDSRVKILKNDSNKGPNYSKNKGLNIAKGKYVSFLDADDWFSLDAFEKLILIMEDNKLDLLFFNNIVYYDENHNFKVNEYYNQNFLNKFENKIFNHFDLDKSTLFNIPNHSWNKIYLRSFLEDNNIIFPNENCVYGDSPFFYKSMTYARRISLIGDCLYNKRKKINSIFDSSKKIFDKVNVSYLIFDVFKDNFQLYQYYKNNLLKNIFQKILNETYEDVDGKFKEQLFIEIQNVYNHFIKDYGAYEDILTYVDKDILDKFNFQDISNEISNFKSKITIIIPVYNAGKFLKRCMDSVLNQTMRDIEIVCIDDGSSDNSLDMLNKFRNNDYRVRVFSQRNVGPALSRNKGIKKAKGDYVLFVDSDDWVEPNMCEELYNHAKHLNSDLILFDATENNLEKELKMRRYFPNDSFNEDYNEFTFNYNFNKKLVLNHFLVVWSKMYKKDLLINFEFPDVPIFEDVLFHVKSMLLADKISYFPNLFYHYMKLNTKSEQNFKVKTRDSLCIVDVFKEVYVFLIEKNYFNEFESNFLMFVLKESGNVLNRIDNEYKEELFNSIKSFYNSLDISLDSLKKIPLDLSEFFNNIVNSENYLEFQCSQEGSNIE